MNIKHSFQVNATIISNEFIDQYMAGANGEYLKEYLYLLRHEGRSVTVSMVADALNHTEADVARALAYWRRAGILNEEAQADSQKGAAALSKPAVSPLKPYTAEQMNTLVEDKEFSQLLYIAQKYMNRVFTQRDCEKFAYLYDGLSMSGELLEYVVEYCVQGGHTSIHYMESVAISWHEKGYRTAQEARDRVLSVSKDFFSVMKAFGINDRNPGKVEREMMERWFQTYGFSRELVTEACNRTLAAIHKPNFQYADGILEKWKSAGVRSLQDVKQLDEQHAGSRMEKAAALEKQGTVSVSREGDSEQIFASRRKTSKNQFLNYPQRSIDYDALDGIR